MSEYYSGGFLSRQTSITGARSYIQPRSLSAYEDAFSFEETGWLDIKESPSSPWERRWFSFTDGELSYTQSQNSGISDPRVVIPIENIMKLISEDKDDCLIVITNDRRITIRSNNIDDLNRWKFSFQKSVALTMTKIKSGMIRDSWNDSTLNTNELNSELGFGHGYHNRVVQRRRSLVSATDAENDDSIDWNADDTSPRNRPRSYRRRHDGELSLVDLTKLDAQPAVTGDTAYSAPNTPMTDKRAAAIPILKHTGSNSSGHSAVHSSSYSHGSILSHAAHHSSGYHMTTPPHSPSSDSSAAMTPIRPGRKRTSSSDEGAVFAMEEDMTCDNGCDDHTKLRWVVGTCSIQGPRSYNEDRYVAIPDLQKDALNQHIASGAHGEFSCLSGGPSQAFFAVYDGHCGVHASTHLQNMLHHAIYKHPKYGTDNESAISETCVQTDKDFLKHCVEKNIASGTTALGVFIQQNKLILFNIGDCEAVLSCESKLPNECVALNSRHSPGREDERQRVRDANGWITEEKELYLGKLRHMDLNNNDAYVMNQATGIDWVTIYRVCGDMAVSRSIGDPDYKGFVPGQRVDGYFHWPATHDQTFSSDLLIPNPEVVTVELTNDHEFLILASDGLWDVVSKPEAVRRTRLMLGEGKELAHIAEELCDLAIRCGGSDNVTIVIVQFVHL